MPDVCADRNCLNRCYTLQNERNNRIPAKNTIFNFYIFLLFISFYTFSFPLHTYVHLFFLYLVYFFPRRRSPFHEIIRRSKWKENIEELEQINKSCTYEVKTSTPGGKQTKPRPDRWRIGSMGAQVRTRAIGRARNNNQVTRDFARQEARIG